MSNFIHGAPITFVESKKDQLSGKSYFPQPLHITNQPHTHDHIGGGGIAFNAWHSLMIRALTDPLGDNYFFRFTTVLDNLNNPVEIPDGIPINSSIIEDSPNYNSEVAPNQDNVPKYMGVWQFIYSADKLEKVWASL